jgi:hypothetical protein
MVLAGPITFTPDDWATLFTTATVTITVVAAISAAVIVAAARASRGVRSAALGAGRAVLVVAAVGLLVGVVGSNAVRSQSPEGASSTPTTAFVPALRPDDEMPFTGDEVAAERDRAAVEQVLAPLAASGSDPATAEVEAALAAALGAPGWRPRVTRPGDHGGVTFVVETDDGCISGSVAAGAVDVQVGGYIRDGGCIAATGH